jgi:hypothetical protein
MRRFVATLMVSVLLVLAGGCSGGDDDGKGVDVKVENKDKGGY